MQRNNLVSIAELEHERKSVLSQLLLSLLHHTISDVSWLFGHGNTTGHLSICSGGTFVRVPTTSHKYRKSLLSQLAQNFISCLHSVCRGVSSGQVTF